MKHNSPVLCHKNPQWDSLDIRNAIARHYITKIPNAIARTYKTQRPGTTSQKSRKKCCCLGYHIFVYLGYRVLYVWAMGPMSRIWYKRRFSKFFQDWH